MCKECGNEEHPEFEDIASEIMLLDQTSDRVVELENDRTDNGFSFSTNPYPVDYFAQRYVEQVCVPFMNHEIHHHHSNPVAAAEKFGTTLFLIGFSVALMSRDYWLNTYPGLYEPQNLMPPEEKIAVWLAEQQKMRDERNAASENFPSPETIKKALADVGVTPEALAQLNLERLGIGGEETQIGSDGYL